MTPVMDMQYLYRPKGKKIRQGFKFKYYVRALTYVLMSLNK